VLDAAQSFVKAENWSSQFECADAVVISPHKFYGPKGVSALIYRPSRINLKPMIVGGGQEQGLRSGTENMPALALLNEWLNQLPILFEMYEEIRGLRDKFETEITTKIPTARILAYDARRLKNTSTVAFPGVDSESMIAALDSLGIMASPGSACHSGSSTPSPTYLAHGLSWELARSVVRFSFGLGNLKIDVAQLVDQICRAYVQSLP
ncbi:MAG: aminotransferase class V-fold PLP-dependent enzyme, partial [Bdellovibrionaceae bacterium]|nr:aminotransferase class V-fold PLP-dependent enzyme [Pseudobdellovibrionaceae bacterium]